VDGYDKVTGRARYAADVAVSDLAYAVLVQSEVPHGRVRATAPPGSTWRVRTAENSLLGNAPSPVAFHTAADLAVSGANALSQNGFKIDLGRHSVVRALTLATKD
jgi:xanthine dehydrogenase YagS FAD-binding subunit